MPKPYGDRDSGEDVPIIARADSSSIRAPDENTPILGHQDGRVQVPSSLQKTFGNIVISVVGAGILGLPYTFKRSGWLFGSLAVVVVAILSYHCMMLLVRTRRKLRTKGELDIFTYGDLGLHTFGPWGSFAVDAMVLLSQGCFCVAYLIFIGENLQSIFKQPKSLFLLGLMPFQILLSWVRSLTGLAPFSIFADITEVLAMCIVLRSDIQNYQGFAKVHALTKVSSMPFAVGVAIYAYEGFPLTLPLEACMKKPNKFPAVLALALACITLLYVSFGLLGYLAFGPDTKDIITLNLPAGWMTDAVKAGLCIGLFFTFPVMMHPCHEIIEIRLLRSTWFQEAIAPSPRLRKIIFNVLRMVVVLLACWAAISIPGFSYFMSIVGSTVCAMLAFVLPATFHSRVMANELNWFERYIVNPQLVVFGLAFTFWGTWSAISNHG